MKVDRNLKEVLKSHLDRHHFLVLENGKKHARVRNTRTGDWIPVAGSSSDRRAKQGFLHDLRRLIDHGCGLIHDRGGKTQRFTQKEQHV